MNSDASKQTRKNPFRLVVDNDPNNESDSNPLTYKECVTNAASLALALTLPAPIGVFYGQDPSKTVTRLDLSHKLDDFREVISFQKYPVEEGRRVYDFLIENNKNICPVACTFYTLDSTKKFIDGLNKLLFTTEIGNECFGVTYDLKQGRVTTTLLIDVIPMDAYINEATHRLIKDQINAFFISENVPRVFVSWAVVRTLETKNKKRKISQSAAIFPYESCQKFAKALSELSLE